MSWFRNNRFFTFLVILSIVLAVFIIWPEFFESEIKENKEEVAKKERLTDFPANLIPAVIIEVEIDQNVGNSRISKTEIKIPEGNLLIGIISGSFKIEGAGGVYKPESAYNILDFHLEKKGYIKADSLSTIMTEDDILRISFKKGLESKRINSVAILGDSFVTAVVKIGLYFSSLPSGHGNTVEFSKQAMGYFSFMTFALNNEVPESFVTQEKEWKETGTKLNKDLSDWIERRKEGFPKGYQPKNKTWILPEEETTAPNPQPRHQTTSFSSNSEIMGSVILDEEGNVVGPGPLIEKR